MRIWIALLVLALLAVPALAEGETDAFGGALHLELGEKLQLDLDADGVDETLFTRSFSQEGWDDCAEVCVSDDDGSFYSFQTDILYSLSVYVADLDGDGRSEILPTGDVASDDYVSYCLRLNEENGLEALKFADVRRGENASALLDAGYGEIVAISGNRLTLAGTQDVLGTWVFSRELALKDGSFVTVDDGLWHALYADNEDVWEYWCLTLARELDVTLEDGSTATLQAGDRFYPTATDKLSVLYFVTEDGRRGSFGIEPDPQGWGSLVAGEPESSYFEFVPYAD